MYLAVSSRVGLKQEKLQQVLVFWLSVVAGSAAEAASNSLNAALTRQVLFGIRAGQRARAQPLAMRLAEPAPDERSWSRT